MGDHGRGGRSRSGGSRRKQGGGRRAQQSREQSPRDQPSRERADAGQDRQVSGGQGSGGRGSGGRAADRRSRRRQRRPRGKFVLLLWVLLPVLLVGGAGATWVYFKLDGNLKSVDIDAALGGDRPPEIDNGSLDILVLGSDSRQGDNKKYGEDVGNARSDVAMIVHVHQGGEKASVVSIPRDTLVTRPQCMGRTKIKPEAKRQVFNTAYEVGGPVCAVKTVEKLSGMRMDHYLEVDFTGFKELIDSLGGISMTTNKAIKDPKSHLDLPPGTHQLNGEQSLGLVRTRKSVGDGSDLGRIQLQQAFMKALMEQIKDIGVLSPKKLFNLADASTKTLTTDSKLSSVGSLVSFGSSLSGIGAKDMKVITLPIDYDDKDPYRVVPLKDQSELLWLSLRTDKQIPDSVTEDSAGEKVDAGKIVKGD
jgi:LCP family protein required for cell wall assembly